MTADEALKAIQFHAPFPTNVVGPKGGNIKNPTKNPHWRHASFNGSIEKGLHKFIATEDKALGGLKNEQQWHRMAAYMFNAGRTASEVALAANVSTAEVYALRAQRWFQELCATIANTEGEEILGALKSHVLDAVQATADLMHSAESESVRASCAKTIIEQVSGKPLQKIISDVTSRRASSPKEEYEQLTSELAGLRGE